MTDDIGDDARDRPWTVTRCALPAQWSIDRFEHRIAELIATGRGEYLVRFAGRMSKRRAHRIAAHLAAVHGNDPHVEMWIATVRTDDTRSGIGLRVLVSDDSDLREAGGGTTVFVPGMDARMHKVIEDTESLKHDWEAAQPTSSAGVGN